MEKIYDGRRRLEPLYGLDGARAVRSFNDLIPGGLQYQAQTVADIRLVFDDEDTTRAALLRRAGRGNRLLRRCHRR